MLKGLITSTKEETDVTERKKIKEFGLRPQEGSLTAYWMKKNMH